MSSEIVHRFAELHQGGGVADAGDNFRPRKDPNGNPTGFQGDAYLTYINEHLYGEDPLGVYPLIGDPPTVMWGAIDWDIGDEYSLIHAANVTEVLKQQNIESFTELSRSKGAHLWVYAKEPVSAKLMRNSLMAACLIVKAGIDEVYPKQTKRPSGGWGNGIRLPYPGVGRVGRQLVRKGSWTLSLEEFVQQAWAARVSAEQLETLESLAPKIVPPSPIPTRRTSWKHKRVLKKISQDIWDNGPQMIDGKIDRSKSMFTLGIGLARSGFDIQETASQLSEWDARWGRKFTERPDAHQQYIDLATAARRRFETDQGTLNGT